MCRRLSCEVADVNYLAKYRLSEISEFFENFDHKGLKSETLIQSMDATKYGLVELILKENEA